MSIGCIAILKAQRNHNGLEGLGLSAPVDLADECIENGYMVISSRCRSCGSWSCALHGGGWAVFGSKYYLAEILSAARGDPARRRGEVIAGAALPFP